MPVPRSPEGETEGETPNPERIRVRDDFARELTLLRLRAGLTVRQVAAGSDTFRNHSTIGDWFAGRGLPSTSSRELLIRVLAVCGVDDPGLVARWLSAWQRVRRTPGRRPRDPEPYRGLAGFEAEHAEWFFGREALTRELVDRLAARDGDIEGAVGVQVVVGVSGSGKSSLLRAGLVHAVRHDGLLGPDWSVALFTPGARPCDELAGRLAAAAGLPTDDVAARLRADPARAGEYATAGERSRLLLVVDQFEELFTACADDAERRAFVTALCAVAGQSAARVVIGLRADFYAPALRYPELVAAVRADQLTVGPMSATELRRAIVEPARRAGVEVEEGLVELLIGEVVPRGGDDGDAPEHAAGALPLLSHALYATWQHSRDRRLTIADYRAVGGIDRAVATSADAVYDALDEAGRHRARRLFLSLVHVSPGAVDTRRRVSTADLLAECGDPAGESTDVIGRFVEQRLLTRDAKTVGISHEALLTAWPLLRGWLEVDRAGLLTGRRLNEAAVAWDREHRDAGALYRGVRLAVAREWARTVGPHAAPGPVAREFLEASAAREVAEQRAAQRRARRLRRLVAVLTVLLLLTTAAVVVAVRSEQTLRTQRDTALAGKVANEATALRPADPALSAQLSLAAYRLAPIPESRGALLSTYAAPYATRLTAHTSAVYAARFSPDGSLLATAGIDRTIRLWWTGDVRRPAPLATLTGHGAGVTSAVFGPDGSLLATAGDDRTARLWDVSDPRRPATLATLTGHTEGVIGAAFSGDGRVLATASYDRTVRLWDVSDPRRPVPAAVLRGFQKGASDVAFSPNGRILAATGFDTPVRLWEVTDPARPRRLPDLRGHTDRVLSAVFGPDGRVLATGGFDNTIRLWDLRDPGAARPLSTLTGHGGGVVALAFDREGHTLVSGGYDLSVRIWDVRDPRRASAPVTLAGHAGVVYTVAVDPRGGTVVSGGADTSVRLWNLRQPILTGHYGQVNAVAFTPDRRLLATGSHLTAYLWDVADPHRPRLSATLTGHADGVTGVAFQPGASVLATVGLDDTLRLWDVTRPGRPALLSALNLKAGDLYGLAFSPDGATLATVGEDSDVGVWDVTDVRRPRRAATLRGHTDVVNAAAFGPDGQVLATVGDDRTTRLWDMRDPRRPTPLATIGAHSNSVNAVAFGPDGRTLATAGDDHTIRLWDLRDPRRPAALATLNGHTSRVNAVAFGPDGRTLATASTDHTVRLWDTTRPRQAAWTATLTAHTDGVSAVAFGSDGHTLATGGNDTTARLWDTDTGRVSRWVCSLAGAPIAEAEWRRYLPDLDHRPPCR
ncbi:hypothetical protein ACFY3V_33320 [Streptosporangium sp. NPDC000095]|uniref:nSTAND1 domain-containing NTPase n=1 Tax=Streptosporangium sp. NPDC000095 TaxID=3366184 RepID=UPI0036738A39